MGAQFSKDLGITGGEKGDLRREGHNKVLVETRYLSIKVVGDTPLLVDNRSGEVASIGNGLDLRKQRCRTPWEEYCNSLYWLTKKPQDPSEIDVEIARFGFPAIAFKKSAVDAAYEQRLITKRSQMRGAFCILNIDGLVEIEGRPQMQEYFIRCDGHYEGSRYHAKFKEWSAKLIIQYVPDRITPEIIMHMIDWGGQLKGIGVYRPYNGGEYGTFHVAGFAEFGKS